MATFPNWDITITPTDPDLLGRRRLRLLLVCPPISRPVGEGFLRRLSHHPDNQDEKSWIVIHPPQHPQPTFGYLMKVSADLSDEDLERALRHMEYEVMKQTGELGLNLLRAKRPGSTRIKRQALCS